MANTSTLIETIPYAGILKNDGRVHQYLVSIDTINTYVNIHTAAPDSDKNQVIHGLLLGTTQSTNLQFGLSAVTNFPVNGINGPHGLPMSLSVYLYGTKGYRIQVQASVACSMIIFLSNNAVGLSTR